MVSDILEQLDFDYTPHCEVRNKGIVCPYPVGWRFQVGCCHETYLVCSAHAKGTFEWSMALKPDQEVTCKSCSAVVSVQDFFLLLVPIAEDS